MTDSLFVTLLLCVLSGVFAVALTKTTMKSYIAGAIPGLIPEFTSEKKNNGYTGGHGVTKVESGVMALLAAVTTYALTDYFGAGNDGLGSILFAVFAAFGVTICYTDLLEYLIFNITVYPLYAYTALGLLMYWHASNLGPDFLIGALIGGVASYLIYFLQWWLSGGRMGFGDVRLSAPVGAIAGAFGASLPVFAIVAANVLALLTIIITNIVNSRSREGFQPYVAFGPFMIFALPLLLPFLETLTKWWDTNMAAVAYLFTGAA